jgi:sugar phosphate isomerase/epimerase
MAYRLTRRDFLQRTAIGFGSASCLAATTATDAAPQGTARFTPRFAICNETFADWPFEKACGLTAEAGYQGIEIAPFTLSHDVRKISPQQRRTIRQQASSHDLEVVGLHWLLAKTQGFHLTSPDRGVRRRTAEYLAALANFCVEIGGKVLVFGSPQQRNLAAGISQEEGRQYAADVLSQALPTLEQTGVTIAMEPLSPTTTNFLTTAAEAMQLIRLVDSPRCQLILDCNAMATETVPIPALIRKYQSALVHFHANDPNQQGPGFGDLDFVPILAALRSVAFQGWISVEVFDYKPGPKRLAHESIAYLKKCIPLPPAPSGH